MRSFRAVVLVLIPTVVAAAEGPFVQLDDLRPATDRVIVVPGPAPKPWGVEQLIQLPLKGDVRAVRAAGDVAVHLTPGRTTRVAVRTDPGLLSAAVATLEAGQLRLDSGTRTQVPSYLVEAAAPTSVRADDRARVEVASWTGDGLTLLAYGEGEIRVGSVRAKELRVIARHHAKIVITGPCEAADLLVDTADAATFEGCGVASKE